MLSKLISFLLLAAMSALFVISFDWVSPSQAQVACDVAQVQSQDQCDAAQAFVTAANKTPNSAPTTIDSVVITDNYALLGWTIGESGGQAILKKTDTWAVVRGVGGSFGSAEGLTRFGVPPATAQALWLQRSTDQGTP